MAEDEDADDDVPDGRLGIIALAVAVEGGLIVIALVLGWAVDQPPLHTFKVDLHAALIGVAATVPLLILFLLMMRWPIGPLASIKRFSEEVLRPLLAPCTVVDLIGISVLAGFGEEMFFRGVLQALFSRWIGIWGALAAASILFGLMHSISPTYVVVATVLGVFLGWLWIWTGNLLAPVLVHALYDMVVLLYLLRGPGSAAPVSSE